MDVLPEKAKAATNLIVALVLANIYVKQLLFSGVPHQGGLLKGKRLGSRLRLAATLGQAETGKAESQ
jgi:hypothetical protein